MSSSFSMLSDSLLETLSTILECLDQLHTVSIEFTVLREKSLPIGLDISIQCLLAEQKDTCGAPHTKKVVKIFKKNSNGGRIPL